MACQAAVAGLRDGAVNTRGTFSGTPWEEDVPADRWRVTIGEVSARSPS